MQATDAMLLDDGGDDDDGAEVARPPPQPSEAAAAAARLAQLEDGVDFGHDEYATSAALATGAAVGGGAGSRDDTHPSPLQANDKSPSDAANAQRAVLRHDALRTRSSDPLGFGEMVDASAGAERTPANAINATSAYLARKRQQRKDAEAKQQQQASTGLEPLSARQQSNERHSMSGGARNPAAERRKNRGAGGGQDPMFPAIGRTIGSRG